MKLPTKEKPVRLYQGDCLNMLRALPDECATAVVTDPPAGIGFMGRAWDKTDSMFDFIEFMRERMAEALRATVPGGLALVWAHPKTEDWTSIACRLAGWERVGWHLHLFASGMPKGFLSACLAEAAGIESDCCIRPSASRDPASTDYALQNGKLGGSCDGRRHQLMSTFRVPSVEPWLVFRKPTKTSLVENLREHGTGYWPIGDYRVPREKITATQGRQGGGTSALFDSGAHLKRYENTSGSLPKDVELICAPACDGDEHAEECPTREIAARGRVGKNGEAAFVRASGGSATAALRMSSTCAQGRKVVSYGDKGDSSRYFHRYGADVGEEALATWAPKAKAQLRLSTADATEKDLRDRWRLFVLDKADGSLVELPGVDAWNGWVTTERVRVRATNERHRWCEHLFWRNDSTSPVGWRRVPYGAWTTLPKGQRGHGNVHPTVKAQALVRPLVATATGSVADPLVLDPFGGSGAVAQACLALGCRVVTAEQDPIVGWPIITAKMAGAAREFSSKT